MIFVFGSNTQGRHGKGAALEAKRRHGAIYGVPMGLQGNSYAIITKELRFSHSPITITFIKKQIRVFLHFARLHPHLTFYVSPIGCGLAGFVPEQIAPMFLNHPKNVKLCPEFEALQ